MFCAIFMKYFKPLLRIMRTITHTISLALIALVCFQCNPKKTQSGQEETAAEKSKSYRLEQVWASDTLFKTPESVIYDASQQVYYVSNVNQNPWEKDLNGFISKMDKGGEILVLEWVTGLSGPKGMAIVDDILFVADLDELVLINIADGGVKQKILVEGASGLNDITPGASSDVYFSDSNEGKIFRYANGEVSVFHSDTPGRPNGLFMDQSKLFTAFSQATELVSYDLSNLEKKVIATEIGAGDGITPTNDAGTYLVSDWNGEIFVVSTDGFKQSILNTKDENKNTADIWFVQEESLVLVPTFYDNRVVAYKLVKE
jgi:hypothetical protein